MRSDKLSQGVFKWDQIIFEYPLNEKGFHFFESNRYSTIVSPIACKDFEMCLGQLEMVDSSRVQKINQLTGRSLSCLTGIYCCTDD